MKLCVVSKYEDKRRYLFDDGLFDGRCVVIKIIILVIDDNVREVSEWVDDQSFASLSERDDRSQLVELVHLSRPLIVKASAATRRRHVPGRYRCRHGRVVCRCGGLSPRWIDRNSVVGVARNKPTWRRLIGTTAASRLFACVVATITAPCSSQTFSNLLHLARRLSKRPSHSWLIKRNTCTRRLALIQQQYSIQSWNTVIIVVIVIWYQND